MPRKAKVRRDTSVPACHSHCGYDGTIWAQLQWWCPADAPDETPQPNCGHIHTVKAHGKTICSWCLGTLGTA